MGAALRRSLENVTAVFAPSCIGHSVLDKREWMSIKIDDISLPDAMRCWEISTENQQRRFGSRRDRKSMTKEEKELRRQLNRERQMQKRKHLGLVQGESPNEERGDKKNHKKGHKKNKKKKNNHHKKELHLITAHVDEDQEKEQNITTSNNIAVFQDNDDDDEDAGQRKHKQNQRRNHNKQDRERKRGRNKAKQRRKNEVTSSGTNSNNNSNKPNHQHRHKNQRQSPRTDPKKCALRLLEKCSWPHCNHSCPSLTNPVTGEEMRLLELLASFGLDIDAVASALGIDMQTLKNMDHAELVNLLTQQQVS